MPDIRSGMARKKYVLHLIPSGILHRGKTCVIGNGVVLDPVHLVHEIDGLLKLKIGMGRRLFISENAHLVMPYHRELDALREQSRGKKKISPTKRGDWADLHGQGIPSGDPSRGSHASRTLRRIAQRTCSDQQCLVQGSWDEDRFFQENARCLSYSGQSASSLLW